MLTKEETAMIELTEEQRQAVAMTGGMPLTIVDPTTKETYFLIRSEAFERLRGVFDEDDARLMSPLLAELDPEDWEDASVYADNP